MDTEWRQIKGYEGIYEVSSDGQVRSLAHRVPSRYKTRIVPGKILKPKTDKDGYLKVCLSKNNIQQHRLIHRLVAEAFIPNPNGYPVINHKDEIKTNNHTSNLEWCTVKYNTEYNDGFERRAQKRRVPVKAINGDEVLEFNSIQEASKVLGINHANIIGCLKGSYGRKTCKGYRFEC